MLKSRKISCFVGFVLTLSLFSACSQPTRSLNNTNDSTSLPNVPNVPVTPGGTKSISYSQPGYVFKVGQFSSTSTLSITGAVPTQLNITPANLPDGITFSKTTGVISGTPKGISPSTQYTVTAGNAPNGASTTVTISVANLDPITIQADKNKVPMKLNDVSTFTITNPNSSNVTINQILLNDVGREFKIVNAADDQCSTKILNSSNCTVKVTFVDDASFDSTNLTVLYTDANGSSRMVSDFSIQGIQTTQTKSIQYINSPFTFGISSTIDSTKTTPISTGVAPTLYSISPALPTGLNFNTTTGQIWGTTTTAPLDKTQYTVLAGTGTQSGDSDAKATIYITISKSILPNVTVDHVNLWPGNSVATITFTNMDLKPITLKPIAFSDSSITHFTTDTSGCDTSKPLAAATTAPAASGGVCTVKVTYTDTAPPQPSGDTETVTFTYTDSFGSHIPVVQQITGNDLSVKTFSYNNSTDAYSTGESINSAFLTPAVTCGPQGTSPCGTVTYSLNGKNPPTGLIFDVTTGLFSGIPTDTTEQAYNLTIYAGNTYNGDSVNWPHTAVTIIIVPAQQLTVQFIAGTRVPNNTRTDLGLYDDEEGASDGSTPTYNHGYYLLTNNTNDEIVMTISKNEVNNDSDANLNFDFSAKGACTTGTTLSPENKTCIVPVNFINNNGGVLGVHTASLMLTTVDHSQNNMPSPIYNQTTLLPITGTDTTLSSTLWQCPDVSELNVNNSSTNSLPANLALHWVLTDSTGTTQSNYPFSAGTFNTYQFKQANLYWHGNSVTCMYTIQGGDPTSSSIYLTFRNPILNLPNQGNWKNTDSGVWGSNWCGNSDVKGCFFGWNTNNNTYNPLTDPDLFLHN